MRSANCSRPKPMPFKACWSGVWGWCGCIWPWGADGRLTHSKKKRRSKTQRFGACLVGCSMADTHAGDMIGEIALAIEMGAGAVEIGKTIHPHSTLGESIGMAAEVAHGSCTDLTPVRK